MPSLLKITVSKENHQCLYIRPHDDRWFTEYGVIEEVRGHNRLREIITIIRKHSGQKNFFNLELAVMESADKKFFLLLTRNDVWRERGHYYAGIVRGVERIKRSIRKKNHQP